MKTLILTSMTFIISSFKNTTKKIILLPTRFCGHCENWSKGHVTIIESFRSPLEREVSSL